MSDLSFRGFLKERNSLVRVRDPLMGWLRLVGLIKLYVSLAKEPYKRDIILSCERPLSYERPS